MSVFGDFQQVWLQRFPESPLPGAWEEDVRANLAKHKQKVSLLKEELEKEEFYVEYLERLLSDVEQHKKKMAKEKIAELDESNDVIGDSISKCDVERPASLSLNVEDSDVFPVNRCVNEISKQQLTPGDMIEKFEPTAPPDPDPGTFVTVIEVNGLKQGIATTPVKSPPKIPARPDSLKNKSRTSNSDSISSSSEFLAQDEPYYDMVATEDDYSLIKSNHSSTENVFSSSSTLPLDSKRDSAQNVNEPQSPGTSNYVNIEYFIQSAKKDGSRSSSEDEEHDEIPDLRIHNNNDNSSYASSSSLESNTPASRRKFSQDVDTKGEPDKMYKSILNNITDSESNYVDWLSVLLKYMKAMQATIGTSQPIVSESELNTIFYKIPELYNLHSNFLEALKRHLQKWDAKIGEHFKFMASKLSLYGAFLSNYGHALDTVRKCSAANSQFSEISKHITYKHLSITLEELLHKPVARVQKNALVLHDLLKHCPPNHSDHHSLTEALNLTQNFLDQFNMIQTKSMFPVNDRAQRRLVKNSFIVEYVDGHRKLRHLFLFNDVIACAKYKPSGRNEKYTFELKWFIPVEDILTLEETTANQHEVAQSNIVSLKSQASNVRDQLRQEEKANEDKSRSKLSRGSDKYRKRLIELESQLVLVSPNLVYRIKNRTTGKTYIFFLSSDFERTQWIEAILTLQKTERTGKLPTQPFSMFELQTWITACRQFLKTNMGSYLLRSGNDESLLVGDLHIYIYDMCGLDGAADLFVCVEVDFYGHFFQKARTKVISSPQWNENFVIDLEGCENLRILVYRDDPKSPTLFGKDTLKLSRKWLSQHITDKTFSINGCNLRIGLKYIPCEVSLRRVPTGKVGALFGEKIQAVCKRQKRNVPFIITACIREVERRGMSEVGIYRVSGSALDISKLKKSFETNSYEAEQMLKEVDIHSVTGILRLYLRELPEALFTDHLYPELLEAFNQSNGNLLRRIELLNECFAKLPLQNRETIKCILDHLIRIHMHEQENKMSLHNLATVFGPTLLRPGTKADSAKQKDTLAAGTVDVMAQAGILYCYLQDLLQKSNR